MSDFVLDGETSSARASTDRLNPLGRLLFPVVAWLWQTAGLTALWSGGWSRKYWHRLHCPPPPMPIVVWVIEWMGRMPFG